MGTSWSGAGHVDRFVAAYEDLVGAAGTADTGVHMTRFIQYLLEEGWDVQAAPVDGGWLEVDSVADLETYEGLADSEEPLEWL